MSFEKSYKDAKQGIIPLRGHIKHDQRYEKPRKWEVKYFSIVRGQAMVKKKYHSLDEAQRARDHLIRKFAFNRILKDLARRRFWIEGPNGFDSRKL